MEAMQTDIESLLKGFTLLRDVLTIDANEFSNAARTIEELVPPAPQQQAKPGPPLDEFGNPIKRKRGRPKGSTNGGIIKDPKVLQEELERKLAALTMLEQENRQLNNRCKVLELVMEIKQEEVKRLQAVQAGEADAQLAAVKLSTEILSNMRIQDMAGKAKDLMLNVGGALMKSELDGDMTRLVAHVTPLRMALKYITLLRPDRLLMSGCNVLEMMNCLEDVSVAPESHWAEVVNRLQVTREQCMWAWTLKEMFNRWHAKLMAERGEISAAISKLLSVNRYGNVFDGAYLGTITDTILLDKMHANIIKERCLIVLTAQVFAHKILTDVQVARLIVYAYPYVSDDIAVLAEVASRHGPPTHVPVQLSAAAAAATKVAVATLLQQDKQQQAQQLGNTASDDNNSMPPGASSSGFHTGDGASDGGGASTLHSALGAAAGTSGEQQGPSRAPAPLLPSSSTQRQPTGAAIASAAAAAACAMASTGQVPAYLLQAAAQAGTVLLPSGQLQPSNIPPIMLLPPHSVAPVLPSAVSSSGAPDARHSNAGSAAITPPTVGMFGGRSHVVGPSAPGGPAAAAAVAAAMAVANSGANPASMGGGALRRVTLAAPGLGTGGPPVVTTVVAPPGAMGGHQDMPAWQQQQQQQQNQAGGGGGGGDAGLEASVAPSQQQQERVSILAAAKGSCDNPAHHHPGRCSTAGQQQQQQQQLQLQGEGVMHRNSHTGSSGAAAAAAPPAHPPASDQGQPVVLLPTQAPVGATVTTGSQQAASMGGDAARSQQQQQQADDNDDDDADALLSALLEAPTPPLALPPNDAAPSPEPPHMDELLQQVLDDLPPMEDNGAAAWGASGTSAQPQLQYGGAEVGTTFGSAQAAAALAVAAAGGSGTASRVGDFGPDGQALVDVGSLGLGAIQRGDSSTLNMWSSLMGDLASPSDPAMARAQLLFHQQQQQQQQSRS